MLDANQLSHFRERQAASLMDTCHKLTYSSSRNDFNEVLDTYTESSTDIPCGLEQKQGEERGRDKDTVVSYDATIRVLITQSFDEKDRIKITKRYGESITAITYQIVSPAQKGPSGIRYRLKKIDL